MNDKPNGATPLESSSSILDKNTIAQIAEIFNAKKDKRLIWDPIKPWIKNSKGKLKIIIGIQVQLIGLHI